MPINTQQKATLITAKQCNDIGQQLMVDVIRHLPKEKIISVENLNFQFRKQCDEREKQNTLRLTEIISSLSKVFNEQDLLKTVEMFNQEKTTKINFTRKIKLPLLHFIKTIFPRTVDENQLLEAAKILNQGEEPPTLKKFIDMLENINGKGVAKNMPRRVQINIWPYKKMNHPGHSSMTVKNDNTSEAIHISLFPKGSLSEKIYSELEKREANLVINYETDAFYETADRTDEKLRTFDELRQLRQKPEANTVNQQFLLAIDDEINDMFAYFKEVIDVKKHDINFQKMAFVDQKYLLAHLVKEKINIRNIEREKPKGIIETAQKNLMERISSRISTIMLDEAFLVPGGPQNIFLSEEKKAFRIKIYGKILVNDEIQQTITDAVTSVLKNGIYFLPLSNQEKDTEGRWITHSEKVYLPLRGLQEKEIFVMFGLDEKLIQSYWVDINNKVDKGEIGYTFISKNENCSGMVAGALAAGGAGYFMPFKSGWFADTPNDIHHYVLQVQDRIDTLNQQRMEIQYFYHSEQQLENATLSVERCLDKFNLAIKEMDSTEKRRFSALADVVKKVSGQEENANEMMQKSILLVEELSDLLDSQPDNADKNSPTHQALLNAAGLLESAWLRHRS